MVIRAEAAQTEKWVEKKKESEKGGKKEGTQPQEGKSKRQAPDIKLEREEEGV